MLNPSPADIESARQRFQLEAEEFIDRWAPKEPRERARFAAEMFSIMRTMSQDISAPWVKQLTDMAALVPFPSLRKP